MFLNTPDYPRCLDRDCMIVMTLSCIFPASLGTIFAGGGYADVHYKLKFSQHKPNAYIRRLRRLVLLAFLPLRHPRPSGRGSSAVPFALCRPRLCPGASIHRTYRRYGTSRRYVPPCVVIPAQAGISFCFYKKQPLKSYEK